MDRKYKINSNLIYREEDNNFFSLKNMEIYQLDEISHIILKNLMAFEIFNYDDFKEIYCGVEGIDIDYCEEFFKFLVGKEIVIE